MKNWIIVICILTATPFYLSAQEDLLALLEEGESTNYVTASFKTNRVINLHSLENTSKGVLDFKIGHRFGFVNEGLSEFFGLDNATIRLGLEMGLTNSLALGIGRSSFEKTVDGFLKYKILRQSTGSRTMPISAAVLATMAIKTVPFVDPERDNLFSSRLYYTYQVILGRKFSDSFTLQISPTLVHRNLVESTSDENDIYALGIGFRQKLTKRLSLNAEYIYAIPDNISAEYKNSFSIGVDLETGGHVFQLHFTNATSMIEKGFVAETVGDWSDGDIHFGFNVSRVFTIFNR